MGFATRKPPTLFALKLRRARLNSRIDDKPVTQTQAASICKVGKKTYHNWETGVTLPTLEHMKRVARIMGIDDDETWLDTGHIPPDMLVFLCTTREGMQTVRNIRRIMETMERNQKPTTRRGAPDTIKFRSDYFGDTKSVQAMQKVESPRRRRPDQASRVEANDLRVSAEDWKGDLPEMLETEKTQ